nr:MAG: putative coat protein [Leviviridae sp.]
MKVMLGSSLTITLDGSGGTAKVLPLINQDGYGTEYFLDDGTVTYRAKVRHSRDNVKAGTQAFDRHNVVFQRFLKPTEAIPLGSLAEVSFTIRNDPNGTAADIIDVSEAMSFYMVKAGGVAAKLLGWES